MPIFVIQRHQAKKLHYDLRLEREGVLESWAIPKDPPLKKGVKRLAVQTEPHELSYRSFTGIIPPGQYGAGKVTIWDNGSYEPIEWTEKSIVVKLNGKRLKGEYCLVHFRPPKNWLFFRRKQL